MCDKPEMKSHLGADYFLNKQCWGLHALRAPSLPTGNSMFLFEEIVKELDAALKSLSTLKNSEKGAGRSRRPLAIICSERPYGQYQRGPTITQPRPYQPIGR